MSEKVILPMGMEIYKTMYVDTGTVPTGKDLRMFMAMVVVLSHDENFDHFFPEKLQNDPALFDELFHMVKREYAENWHSGETPFPIPTHEQFCRMIQLQIAGQAQEARRVMQGTTARTEVSR